MQQQFNNSPLGGRDQALERGDKILFGLFFFFFGGSSSLFLFLLHPPRDVRSDLKKRGGFVFRTFRFPTRHNRRSRCGTPLRLLLIGCHWQNGLWHRRHSVLGLQAVFTGASYLRRGDTDTGGQQRRRQQQQQDEGLSSSNPPQIVSGLLSRNNGVASSAHTHTWLHASRCTIAESCHSWLALVSSAAMDRYNYDTLNENKWSNDWP